MEKVEVLRAHTDRLAIIGFRPAITDEQLAMFPTPELLKAPSSAQDDLPLPVYLREYEDALEVGIDVLVFSGSEKFVDYSNSVVSKLGNCAVRDGVYSVAEYERTKSVFDLYKIDKYRAPRHNLISRLSARRTNR